jgi:L-threonylcarbamoyladenylate synthase
MKTVLTRSPARAAAFLLVGNVAAFPTETVYGLGANAFDEDAIRGIFRAKGRPRDNPLIAHLHDLDQIGLLARRVPRTAERLMDAFFPGPLTLVLPKHRAVPAAVTAGLDTIGIRMPAHVLARAFLACCGFPVAAPSANRSGRPSPTSWQAVRDDLGGRVPCILQGGRTAVGLESTVVDCSGGRPLILREGAVTLEQLREIVPDVRPAPQDRSERPRSPGLKHRHYAPRARVILVADPDEARPAPRAAYLGLAHPPKRRAFAPCRVVSSVEDYARALFHFFHLCDVAGVRTITCQSVPEHGLGRAVMDRLRRAARR